MKPQSLRKHMITSSPLPSLNVECSPISDRNPGLVLYPHLQLLIILQAYFAGSKFFSSVILPCCHSLAKQAVTMVAAAVDAYNSLTLSCIFTFALLHFLVRSNSTGVFLVLATLALSSSPWVFVYLIGPREKGTAQSSKPIIVSSLLPAFARYLARMIIAAKGWR